MNAIKKYWAWLKHPFVSHVAAAVAGGAIVKWDLLTWLLSFV